MQWSEFEENLFTTLVYFPARSILIITPPDPPGGRTLGPFVQFGGVYAFGDNINFTAELSTKNRDGDATFSPEHTTLFHNLGFDLLDEGNWQLVVDWPTPSHILHNITQACITRLRDAGGIETPDQLTYTGWTYPDHRDEIHEEDRDPGTDNLHLRTLGLPHPLDT